MKLFSKGFAFLGTLVVLVAVSALIVPKTARAITAVATLVRDVDNAARDPFQAVFQAPCSGGLGSVHCGGLTVPSVNGAGQTVSMLVIENVAGTCPGGSGPGVIGLTNYSDAQLDSMIGFGGIANTSSTSGFFFQDVFTPNLEAGFSTPTRLYAAPGSRIAGIAFSNCTLTISGHFVTP